MTMEAIDAYEMFMAVRLHFTSAYDYQKYGGKLAAKMLQKFDQRRDKYYFDKLARLDDPLQRVVANVFHDPKVWVTDLFKPEAETIARKRQGVIESLHRTVEADLGRFSSYDDAFVPNPGQPELYADYRSGVVQPETLVVVSQLVPSLFPYWTTMDIEPYVWEQHRDKLLAYSTFVHFDRTKYKTLLVDLFES